MPTKQQMSRLVERGLAIESFEHEHYGHFNITALRNGIENRTIPFHRVLATIDDRMKYIIKECRDIDQNRVNELILSGHVESPCIILLAPDDTHTIVDGNHRIAGLIQLKKTEVKFFMVDMKLAPRVDDARYHHLPNYGQPDFVEKQRGKDHSDAPPVGTIDGKEIKR